MFYRSLKTALIFVVLFFSSLLAFFLLVSRPETPPTDIAGGKTNAPLPTYGQIPLHFEPNVGQAEGDVRYVSRGSGYRLMLSHDAAELSLSRSNSDEPSVPESIKMRFGGANIDIPVSAEGELEGKTNYISGSDPAAWKTNVANFSRVRYSDLYDGIDLVFYGNQRNLEYDFIVAPNSSPEKIELGFDGASKMELAENGDLVFKLESGDLRQHKPYVYQKIDGVRREVSARYRLEQAVVKFDIGVYDETLPLVIDPVLSYSTYLGGNGDTVGTSIAVDSAGNAYVTGNTVAQDFPLVNPSQSTTFGLAGFVTKINPAGTAYVYSTYLGSSATLPTSIKVDGSGNAYVAGFTTSPTFPTTPGAFVTTGAAGAFGRAGFVTKLSPSGSSLVYSTYISGVNNFGGLTELNGLAIDPAGNAYLTGYTQQPTFPTTPGAFKRTLVANTQNAFVSKLNASGSALVYSTFVGINTPVPNTDPFDRANAIAVDSSGNAYITGQTVSQNFPVTNTAFQTFPGSRLDAFVTKLNPTGTGLVYSTYLGGNGDEIGLGIAVDTAGNAYVTGLFDGLNGFPFTPNAFRNGSGERCCGSFQTGFLTKINPSGTALVYSTSLGTGRQAMSGTGIAVDGTGSAYVVGGQGINAAYAVNAVQPVSQNNDAFILKMNPAGTALTYSTNLGGVNGRSSGAAIAIDSSGGAYVTGYTNASNFPITPSAPQSTKPGGSGDSSFITKIATLPSDCPAITINPQPPPRAVRNRSYNLQLTATGGNGTYTFSQAQGFGGDNLPAGLSLASNGVISGTPTSDNYGPYILTVEATDGSGCKGIRTLNLPYVQRIATLEGSITGRTRILRGRPNRYVIQYTNTGDSDLYNVPLNVRFPAYITAQRAEQTDGGDTIVSHTIPRIQAHSSGSTSVTLTVPDLPQYANTSFQMDVRLGSPFPATANFAVPQRFCQEEGDFIDCDTDWIGIIMIFIVNAEDPNDKIGPAGVGTQRFISAESPPAYVINFENKPTATAPAQTIVLTDQLDVSKFDLSSFSFGDITIGNQSFSPPPNRTSIYKDFDLRPANNIISRIEANLNTTSGLLTWRLSSIDPATGLPTDEPLAGILPPNTTTPRGEGSVSFRVGLRSTVASGTQISNQARIVFDTNAPIDTPVWSNTLDLSNPTSSVRTLSASVPPNFVVSWAGTDAGSGVARYTVYVSDNGGPFTTFLTDTTALSGIFAGQVGHTYGFYSIATDGVRNREGAKTSPESTTVVNIAQPTISGRVFTPTGLGLRNALVSLVDPNGVRRTATTSSFGVYSFDMVIPGRMYTVTVSSKRYRFAPATPTPNSNITNLDFIGLE